MSESHRNKDYIVDFLSGWIAGATSIVLLQPLDTILTRAQANVTPTSVARLWRGTTPVLLAAPWQNALLMTGYGWGARCFSQDDDASSSSKWAAIFVGGCTGGVLQSFLTSPVELLKVSQQCATASNATTVHVLRLWSSPQLRWRGLHATLLRDGLPHGVWFVAYDMTKSYCWSGANDDETVPTHVAWFAGAVAATVAWVVGYPFDLIKTRLQANACDDKGILETARAVVQESNGHWISGLYRGLGWKLLRAIPASMISFSVYEAAKTRLAGRL